MPKQRVSKPHGKKGSDGLTDRERAFAVERRKDHEAPAYLIAQRAGFLGDRKVLDDRARKLMKKAAVMAIILAPDLTEEQKLDPAKLKEELQRFFLTMVRGNATHADKIRAADKLGQTLQGFYVPVQMDLRGQLTLEAAVRAMGGAPEESAGMLPGHDNEPDKEDA